MKRMLAVLMLCMIFTGCSNKEKLHLPRVYDDLTFIPENGQKTITEGKYYLDILDSSTGYLAQQYYGLARGENGNYITKDNNLDAPGLYLVTETSASDVKRHLDTLFTPALASELWSLYFTEYNGMAAILDRSAGHGFSDCTSVYTVHRADSQTIEYTEERYYFSRKYNESDEDYAERRQNTDNRILIKTIDVVLQRHMLQWKIESYDGGYKK